MVKEKLYPIGTVVKVEGESLIILGYRQEPVENKFVSCYITAPYPLGFTEIGRLFMIAIHSVDEVLFTGYEDDIIYPEFIKQQRELINSIESVKVSEVEKALDMMINEMEKQEEVNG